MNPASRYRLDCEALYTALDRQRRDRRMSWRKVAVDAGLPNANVLSRLAYGTPPSGDTLLTLLMWLPEQDAAPFTILR